MLAIAGPDGKGVAAVVMIVLGLMAACVALWRQVAALGQRVAALEAGASGVTLARAPVRAEPRQVAPVRVPATPIATPVPPVVAPPASLAPPVPPKQVRTAPPRPPRKPVDFEQLFGRTLPIWAGGVTLAVAGFLLVRYSIDAGLLSPAVRVLLGLVFGAGLIAGAEAALRAEAKVRDPRVRQALAGAGVATLYASVLVAADLYALVPPVVAFVGLAGVTALAAFLSLRFGAPSAVLGLVGGLAAPALVGAGPPDVPLLSLYLALAVGGLCTLGRTQRWPWLGAGALVGGFGWGLTLILGGALGVADSVSLGALLLLLGVALPMAMFPGERGVLVRAAGALAGCAQMAALVATGGFAALDWGLFALLSVATIWLSRREAMLANLPAAALAVALMLAGAWPHPDATGLTLVIAGAVLIFGAPAGWRVWRRDARLSDAGQIAALALAWPLLPPLHRIGDSWPSLAGLAALGATLAGGVAAWGWRAERRELRFAVLVTTAALLVGLAGAALLPWWATAPWCAIVSGGVLLLGHRAGDPRLERVAWAGGAATLAGLVVAASVGPQLARTVGEAGSVGDVRDLLTWAVPALVAALFAWRGRARGSDVGAQPVAVLLGYAALAQVVPAAWLPLVPTAAVAALAFRNWRPALVAAAALAFGWAAWPLAEWLVAAGAAVIGMPLLVTALPSVTDVLLRIALPAAAVALVGCRTPEPVVRRSAWGVAALLGGVALHVAYKHLFAIASPAAFAARGMAERTLWEALLAAAAVAAYRRAPRIAQGLGAAALLHFAWFTALLHDPMWSAQDVGAWPVANLLLPAYGVAFALVWAARRWLSDWGLRARGWAQMALVLLFAASELSQVSHGTLLIHGAITQGEDIARSVFAIAAAVGFLLWGGRVGQRDWRIASLLLMLGAMVKVFLFDASGLTGAFRIASFAALGFSLIGVGWLYSRVLAEPAR